MKTAVLGVGAIGGLVLGYLKEKGVDVCGVARDYQITPLSEEGIVIEGVRGKREVGNLTVYSRLQEKVDLAVFATKTQDLEEIIVNNLDYLKDAYLLTTQNGVAAEYILGKYFDKSKIVSGIVMFGATFSSPNKVLHNFEGSVILGNVFGEDLEAARLVQKILSPAFKASVVSNIKGKKYLKLFINLNNCIPACLGKSMQQVYSDLEVSRLAVKLIAEAYKVVNLSNIVLEDLPTYPAQRVQGLATMGQEQAAAIFSKIMTSLSKEPLYGSILQSIKRGKSSEIDYINGQVVKLAKENNVEARLNEKIVALVHRVEDTKKFLSKEEFLREVNTVKEVVSMQECNRALRVKFPKLKLTVIDKKDYCYHNYNVGDEFILDDFTHPPKHFCSGLIKSVFPCLYALTFGAKFKFMENTRSITTTCPDNAKLSFKVEVLDEEGRVVVEPQTEKPKGPSPAKMVIEVQELTGKCFYNYKKGDKFEVTGLMTPANFCGAAYSVLFPVLFALNFGASFSFEDNPVCKTGTTCPDGGNIKFKVTRK